MKFKRAVDTKSISLKLLDRYLSLLMWFHTVKDVSGYMVLMQRIKSLWNNSGKKFLVTYLKECVRLLQHYISGEPVYQTSSVPRVGITNGLPSIIPSTLRHKIMQKDSDVIRIVLTILSLYRIISYKGTVKISTITDSFKGISPTIDIAEINLICTRLSNRFNKSNLINFARKRLLPLKTAGPNHKVSILGAPLDAICYASKEYEHLLKPFMTLDLYFNSGALTDLLKREMKATEGKLPVPSKLPLKLGKLSKKEEAAGKVRVFAIADVWTQSVLAPLHDYVFSILKNIPQDGCFDQGRPIRLLQDRLKLKDDKSCFSFDLSAATDRFPIDFQVQVLSHFVSRDVAEAWKELLVSRNWYLDGVPYTYGVGQPMGALSSWGVFSLSHHIVVQVAALRAGWKVWFPEYALLGDDIVIADKTVADSYLYLMTEWLGVEINLSKSIQSKIGVMEFAKRLVTPSGELSPLGPKNILLALRAPSTIPSIFLDAQGKGYQLDHGKVRRLIDSFDRNICNVYERNLECLLWSILEPFGFISNSSDFGPSRVESSLKQFGVYNVPIGVIDEVRETIRQVLMDEVRRDWGSALDKTLASYQALCNFDYSDIVLGGLNKWALPSALDLQISGLERYLDLIGMDLSLPDPKEADNITSVGGLIQLYLPLLPSVLPWDSSLVLKRVEVPRFRTTNVSFFNKVNRKLGELGW